MEQVLREIFLASHQPRFPGGQIPINAGKTRRVNKIIDHLREALIQKRKAAWNPGGRNVYRIRGEVAAGGPADDRDRRADERAIPRDADIGGQSLSGKVHASNIEKSCTGGG